MAWVFDENLNIYKIPENNKGKSTKEETIAAGKKTRDRGQKFEEDTKRYNKRSKRRQGILRDLFLLNLVRNDHTYIEFANTETGKTVKFGTRIEDIIQNKLKSSNTLPLSPFTSPFTTTLQQIPNSSTAPPPSTLPVSSSSCTITTPPPTATSLLELQNNIISTEIDTTIKQSETITNILQSVSSVNKPTFTVFTNLSPIAKKKKLPIRQSTTAPDDEFLKTMSPSISENIPPNSVDENTCQICHAEHTPEDDIESPWVDCIEECGYWVHSICLGKWWCPIHRKKPFMSAKRKLIKKK